MSEAGFAALDAHIARLRGLDLARRAAPDAARAVQDELRRQIAAGVDPDGKPWPRTQDGRKPLATAEKALAVGAVGTTIVLRLRGHVARHHRGIARGGIERQILPRRGIPQAMDRAIRRVLADHFREAMRG